jgi:hypothetical protein
MNKNFAKVRLSAEEMRLVTDPAWILTKNSVMGKVVAMFAELSGEWRTGRLPTAMPPTEPKISKGENYKGLPWVMLDYPRVFGREDVCAIRTMFWWGHAFSLTLHLKGEYMRIFLPGIMERREELVAAGFGMGISDDEWAHEHTEETYGPLTDTGGRTWLKLSARVGLEHWEETPKKLTGLYNLLLEVLSDANHR